MPFAQIFKYTAMSMTTHSLFNQKIILLRLIKYKFCLREQTHLERNIEEKENHLEQMNCHMNSLSVKVYAVLCLPPLC